MGHNHSTPSRNHTNTNVVKRRFKSLAKKSNTKNSKPSNNNNNNTNNNRKLRFKLKLSQSQKSSQSSQFSSSRSIPSIDSKNSTDSIIINNNNNNNNNNNEHLPSLPTLNIINDDAKCDDFEENNNMNTTIKDMMIDMINNKTTENNNIKKTENSPRSKSKSKSKSKCKTNQSSKQMQTAADYEKFFIAFHQKQQQKKNNIAVYNTAIQHRVAFVSIIGLYQSFRRIPTHILFSSIFLLKIKREWLYNPLNHVNNQQNVLHTLQYDKDEEFLMLLKWKDSQNLLFFMLNDNNDDNNNNNNNNNDDDEVEFDIDNEEEIILPTDLGIDNEDEDEDEYDNDNDNDNDLKLEIDIDNENAFNFAANIPISTPTHSLHSIDCINNIDEIIMHHSNNNTPLPMKDGFDFDIKMHELDMTNLPNRLSLSASKSNGPNLPLTPTASEELDNFVPPLRLQRNEQNMVNVSDYNLAPDFRICQTIDEEEENDDDDDEDEYDDEEELKFEYIDDEEEEEEFGEFADFDDDSDDSEEPECNDRPHLLRLRLNNDDNGDKKEEKEIENTLIFEPITPETDFGDDIDGNNCLLNPIWSVLSDELSKIYDPFECENYSKLILDKNWWSTHFKESQYGTCSKDIIEELNECDMNYRCVMEILYQSNPSLIPCKTYRELENVSLSSHCQPRPPKLELEEINFVSNTISMTVIDSNTTDYFENEYSNQCNETDASTFNTACNWIIDDYDSNWRKYTTSQSLQ